MTDVFRFQYYIFRIILVEMLYKDILLLCFVFRGTVDTDSSNETLSCQSSVDLPAVGAAEQEHLSSLSIFLILCVLGETVN